MNKKVTSPIKKATIRTVAEDAGVSVAAVSKVLRDAYGVSPSLRIRVQASIDRLDYRPSTAARAMRGKTFSVGIVAFEIANPLIPAVLNSAQMVLERSKRTTMVGIGQDESSQTSVIDRMIDHRMDGLILVAPRLPPERLSEYAKQIPIVVIGYHCPDASAFDTINCDDRLGAHLAVRALLESGYSNTAMLSLKRRRGDEHDVFIEREVGYLESMEAAGLSANAEIVRCELLPPEADDDILAFLKRPDRPRAVFCWSDLHAVKTLNLAVTSGLRIPHDLAVVGFDNSVVAALPLISLASVDQDGSGLGETAARLLEERIDGRRAPSHKLLTPTYIKRASV